jgi:D-glycero-D-manno-heptose 1,7-bisphosphate phosphatase
MSIVDILARSQTLRLYDESAFHVLMEWMCERFRNEQAPLAKVYHCPYHPERGLGRFKNDHAWRKPNPGMFLQAASDLSLHLSGSAVIGDQSTDIAAAAAAGIPVRIRLDPDGAPPDSRLPRHIVVRDLASALLCLKDMVS